MIERETLRARKTFNLGKGDDLPPLIVPPHNNEGWLTNSGGGTINGGRSVWYKHLGCAL